MAKSLAGGKGHKGGNKPQASLATPLTPKTLTVDVNAAARTKFNPATTDIHAQQKASVQQQKNIGSWYDQYKVDLADSYAKTAASYASAALQIGNARDAATAQDTGQQTVLNSDAAQSAAQRGATVDPSVPMRGQMATAANAAAQNRDLNQVAATGAAQSSYAAGKIPVAGAQQVVAHQQESGRRRTIDKSLKDLNQQRADFKINYRTQARKDAFNEQLAVQAGLLNAKKVGILQQNANTNSKNASTNLLRAQNTAAYQQAVIDAKNRGLSQKDAIFQANRRFHTGPFARPNTAAGRRAARRDRAQQRNHTGPYAIPGGGGGSKGPTRTQRQGARSKYDRASTLLHQKGFPSGRSGAIDALVLSHIPRDLAVAAWEGRVNGQVSLATHNRILRRYGININYSFPGPH